MVLLLALALQQGVPWKQYDVNNDGRIDKVDVRRIAEKSSYSDLAALSIKKTQWDQNADGIVSAEDFKTFAPVTMPAANASRVTSLVDVVLAKSSRSVHVPLNRFAAVALVKGDLPTAHWAYARIVKDSAQNMAALSGFAFTLTEMKQYNDALAVLSYARSIDPKDCSVSVNVGSVMARLGHTDQALPFYQEAVTNCPRSGQYKTDLATALLRTGNKAAANAAYRAATHTDPGNIEAALMSDAIQPAASRPATAEQINQMYLAIDSAIWTQLEVTRTQVTEQVNLKVEAIAKAVAPKWKSACEDFPRWETGWQKAWKDIDAAVLDGKELMRQKENDAMHKVGTQQLALSNTVFPMVLYVARDRLRLQGPSGFTGAFNELYDEPIKRAKEKMRDTSAVGSLDDQVLTAGKAKQDLGLVGFVIMTAMAGDPEKYGKGCDIKGSSSPDSSSIIPSDLSVGGSIGVVGVEYSFSTCEVKISGGEGLMGAATWSPYSGFGLQVGVGSEHAIGAAKIGAAAWLKVSSDGHVVAEGSGGLGLGAFGTGLGDAQTIELRPASRESVGVWSELGDFLACDQ